MEGSTELWEWDNLTMMGVRCLACMQCLAVQFAKRPSHTMASSMRPCDPACLPCSRRPEAQAVNKHISAQLGVHLHTRRSPQSARSLLTTAWTQAISLHDKLMRSLMGRYHGYEVCTEGDAFLVCFHSAEDAVAWCVAVQQVRRSPRKMHELLACTCWSASAINSPWQPQASCCRCCLIIFMKQHGRFPAYATAGCTWRHAWDSTQLGPALPHTIYCPYPAPQTLLPCRPWCL